MSQRNLIPCTYIGLKGPCANQCYRGRCSRHTTRKSLTLCLHCKKLGTTASHGHCASIQSGCRWMAQHKSRVIKADREAWDAYIDSLED
jgi:hypothetical protein